MLTESPPVKEFIHPSMLILGCIEQKLREHSDLFKVNGLNHSSERNGLQKASKERKLSI
jgi:hypothetical protein